MPRLKELEAVKGHLVYEVRSPVHDDKGNVVDGDVLALRCSRCGILIDGGGSAHVLEHLELTHQIKRSAPKG